MTLVKYTRQTEMKRSACKLQPRMCDVYLDSGCLAEMLIRPTLVWMWNIYRAPVCGERGSVSNAVIALVMDL